MKKLLFLFALILVSCSSEEQGDMQLTIVNNHSDWKIHQISLQGYSFDEFEINEGDSRTLTLYDGIPSGGTDIGVRIIYDGCLRKDRNEVIRADFEDGKNTIITINEDRTGKEDWQVNCNYTATMTID